MEYDTPAAFLDPDLRERYKDILMSWHGTPYKHLWMAKGRGADCTLFIAACLKELGVLKEVVYEYYPDRWFLSTKKEYILEAFHKHTNEHMAEGYRLAWFNRADYDFDKREELDMVPGFIFSRDRFLFGDILSFTTTKMNVTNHCAVWLDDGLQMLNSVRKQGCIVSTYGSHWERRLTNILRVYRMV